VNYNISISLLTAWKEGEVREEERDCDSRTRL